MDCRQKECDPDGKFEMQEGTKSEESMYVHIHKHGLNETILTIPLGWKRGIRTLIKWQESLKGVI